MQQKGISGSTLKIIALITMLIDHVGAVVVLRVMFDNAAQMGFAGKILDDGFYDLYRVMRNIGRIAFPIYCFLLVEGFRRTKNKIKYVLRLGVFALISEIPFDLALSSRMFAFSYQNVFFTLLIGLLTMLAMEALEHMLRKRQDAGVGNIPALVLYPAYIAVLVVGAFAAELLHADYGAKGIICIVVLYFFRGNKITQALAGACAFLWEAYASLAFIPIALYNGERGLKLKYVFYIFYPLHLLVLYLICVAMGMQGYAVV